MEPEVVATGPSELEPNRAVSGVGEFDLPRRLSVGPSMDGGLPGDGGLSAPSPPEGDLSGVGEAPLPRRLSVGPSIDGGLPGDGGCVLRGPTAEVGRLLRRSDAKQHGCIVYSLEITRRL